ncbi:MAG: transcriptional repressor NrdR [Anaerolineae bacterium]|nr:transcriptional repressor NrdR [Anaerolineae bacterium]
MKCPHCGAVGQSRVVDTSHDARGGIRRRRECKVCEERFSTYERAILATPVLIKAGGEREMFDREKLIRGVRIACAKRPVASADLERLADRIETRLQRMGKAELSSRVVGDMVMDELKELDPIAYIRYAIVYLQLDNLVSIREELNNLLADQSS